MSSYDDIIEMLRKQSGLLASVRNYESPSSKYIQQLEKERIERENLVKLAMPEMTTSTYIQQLEKDRLSRESLLKSAIPEMVISYSNTIESLKPAFAHLRDAESHHAAMVSLSDAHTSLSNILSKYHDFDKIPYSDIALSSSWQESIKSYSKLVDLSSATDISLKSHYSSIAESAFLAQERLLRVNWESLGGVTRIDPKEFSGIHETFDSLTDRYSLLMRSIEESKNLVLSFPPIVSSGPPIEIFTSAGVLNSLSYSGMDEGYSESEKQIKHEIEEQIEVSVIELLDSLDPRLHKTWLGAKEALRSDNPDRKRHVVVSLRELVTHVLHSLAPDKEVQKWTDKPEHFHEGRPTRTARVLYICRGVNHGPFTSFINADVKANVEFIALFQRGTHELDIVFSESQLRALVIHTESFLRFLLLTNRVMN